MSPHYLVAAQTSNVYIIRHAPLNAIAHMRQEFVMSLPVMSFWDWFSVSRKCGTGGGGLVYTPKGWSSIAVCGFGCKNLSLHKWSWKSIISP